jgi:hypothetical protein
MALSGQVSAEELPYDPFVAVRCFASSALYSKDADSVYSDATPVKDATRMTASPLYRAPTTSPRLDTLDIVSVGMSLDVYRQGQVWDQLQQQDARQRESLHVGSILPTDLTKYPVTADSKNNAYDQRKADALELALRNFPEAWPIPTVTVVRNYNAQAPRLRTAPEYVRAMLTNMVIRLRQDAGLHWHEIHQLRNGQICNDTPENTVEAIFRAFEANPDMPALLVYVVDGYNMAGVLSTKDKGLIGVGNGPRQPGELTDSMVALVVARRERVEWLRYFAKYAKPNPAPLSPRFAGWERHPKQNFQPSPFIPQPWTRRGFEQWDALQTLAVLHRPVTVPLVAPDGTRLKYDALTAELANGWTGATNGLTPPPARVFFDSGQPSVALAELVPALKEAKSPLDLLQSNNSYDLTQRLGDTGAASPFVGIALATMASYANADTSVVMPLRRADQATVIAVTSATPGFKPTRHPFGVRLMAQTARNGQPSAIIQEQRAAEHRTAEAAEPAMRAVDPDRTAREKQTLDAFLADGPGVDLFKPTR